MEQVPNHMPRRKYESSAGDKTAVSDTISAILDRIEDTPLLVPKDANTAPPTTAPPTTVLTEMLMPTEDTLITKTERPTALCGCKDGVSPVPPGANQLGNEPLAVSIGAVLSKSQQDTPCPSGAGMPHPTTVESTKLESVQAKCDDDAASLPPSSVREAVISENRRPDTAPLSVSLPHEGCRWNQLRDRMRESVHLQGYFQKMDENPPWTRDEVFASFCLDQVEGILSPTVAETPIPMTLKKVTRRKGRPQKYERNQSKPLVDDLLQPLRKRTRRDSGPKFYNDDEDDVDDMYLAMQDNPSDVDYEPVYLTRSNPKRRKSLPRSINSPCASTKTANQPKKVEEIVPKPRQTKTTPTKVATPKKKTVPAKENRKAIVAKMPIIKTSTLKKPAVKCEKIVPPRKRGRPRKLVTDDKKKSGKPQVKAEKAAKQYVRMEIRIQRLPKMYECKTCFERFPEAEDTKKHFLERHQPGTNPSDINCDHEGPPDSESMKVNIADVSEVANLLRQCPKCQKFVDNMTVHRREHRERNFICEECGKGFTENQVLQKHRKIHEMDRTGDRYKCELCDKTYRFSQNLRSHMLYHGGERTFTCDSCGKSFYTNNRLIIHSAIHMKEKPFKCDECGRGFSQKSNMQKHQRVHTGVKPYKCDLCMESFNHKVSLKNHKKKHHGIDWWKDVGRPKPVATRKPKSPTQSAIVQQARAKPSAAPLDKQEPGSHWTGENSHPAVADVEQPDNRWHRQENELVAVEQHQTEEAVRLQNMHPAAGGHQWKECNNLQMETRQGDPAGMPTFFYPSPYIQGYSSGYSGMPVIPLTTDSSSHTPTRSTY